MSQKERDEATRRAGSVALFLFLICCFGIGILVMIVLVTKTTDTQTCYLDCDGDGLGSQWKITLPNDLPCSTLDPTIVSNSDDIGDCAFNGAACDVSADCLSGFCNITSSLCQSETDELTPCCVMAGFSAGEDASECCSGIVDTTSGNCEDCVIDGDTAYPPNNSSCCNNMIDVGTSICCEAVICAGECCGNVEDICNEGSCVFP